MTPRERMMDLASGEPFVLAQSDLRSSTEAVDGSECSASIIWPADRVHELWVTSRFVMPSGNVYKITEIRWMPYGDDYVAHIRGGGVGK